MNSKAKLFKEIKDQLNNEEYFPIKITIKWGKSKSKETYGDPVCSLYYKDTRLTHTRGKYLDMEAIVLGYFIGFFLRKYVIENINEIFEGLKWTNDIGYQNKKDKEYNKPIIDGSVGWQNIIKILNASGLIINLASETKKKKVFELTKQ